MPGRPAASAATRAPGSIRRARLVLMRIESGFHPRQVGGPNDAPRCVGQPQVDSYSTSLWENSDSLLSATAWPSARALVQEPSPPQTRTGIPNARPYSATARPMRP